MFAQHDAAAVMEAPSMLGRFRDAKRDEIEALKIGTENMPTAKFRMPRLSFVGALRAKQEAEGYAIVAEYKRASPSKGSINLSLSPEEAAQCYSEGGAAAISVLTETRYFGGDLGFLGIMSGYGAPLLRKDFIFHPLQIAATAATSASAALVIVRMLSDEELHDILDACEAYGLEAVVEVFSAEDLERIDGRNVEILQVNNRDLDTLVTDLTLSRDLIGHKKEGQVWISASGYERRDQIEEMAALGYDAFLVGTSLMETGNPGRALAALRSA